MGNIMVVHIFFIAKVTSPPPLEYHITLKLFKELTKK